MEKRPEGREAGADHCSMLRSVPVREILPESVDPDAESPKVFLKVQSSGRGRCFPTKKDPGEAQGQCIAW